MRHAIRSLLRSPAFALAAVLTLALGIGANTAIFSVVDGALLRPAPFREIGRLAMVWETDRKSSTQREPASIPDYFDFQQRSRRFERLSAFGPLFAAVSLEAGEPERVASLAVSHQFLPMVGIQPLLGTAFTAEQDQNGVELVVMISEAFWTERMNRDPNVIGRPIRVLDRPATVIGVLPRSADFGMLQVLRQADYQRGFAEQGRARVDLWLPLRPNPAADRGNHPIFVLGRLAPGASLGSAQDEMTRIASDLERDYHQANDARGVHLEALSQVVFGGSKPALLVLLGAVALVLLVACANVANLLLARGVARAREVAVRSALGAGLGRLTRQFLIESALLTGLGAAAGVFLAYGGLQLLLAWAPASIPRLEAIHIDLRVLAVALGVSVLVAVTFGILPALQALRGGFTGLAAGSAGRGSSPGRPHSRFRSTLVVAQLTLAIMLLAGAGLLIQSFWRLSRVDPGFQVEHVVKADFQLPRSYPQQFAQWPRWTEVQRFAEQVRERLASLPGVQAVAIAGNHPLEAGFTSSISVPGREAEAADWPEPSIRMIDAGYLTVTRGKTLEGRGFTTADDADAPAVVLLNQAARDRFFLGRPALGEPIRLWGSERTVVGVLVDEHTHGLAETPIPAVYLPAGQAPVASGSILVRVAGDPLSFAPALRSAVRAVEPALVLSAVEPMTETMAKSNAERRFTMTVLGVFAGVTLLLAVIGVHGLLSYTVAQRTRELGIRMALGADRGNVRRLVLGQGARLAGIGIGLGVIGAIATTRVLRTLLYGTSPGDPFVLAAAILTLAGVTLLASWLPARRAARTDPAVVLRTE